MAVSTGMGTLPTSNVGGNNQTSPGLGNISQPVATPFTPPQTAGAVPSSNPMMPNALTSTPPGGVPGGGIYNTTSHYSSGATDINKQLVDIYGKGVGGSLDNLIKNLSSTDSAIFQQWLASQNPAQAQQEAAMRQALGTMGVSGNSSVMGLAEANLAAQNSATAAGVNANLMQQGINTTQSILQHSQSDAASEVAKSPWDIAQQVIGTVGDLAGTVTGLGGLGKMFSGGLSGISGIFGHDAAMGGFNPTNFNLGQSLGSGPDLSAFHSTLPSVGLAGGGDWMNFGS